MKNYNYNQDFSSFSTKELNDITAQLSDEYKTSRCNTIETIEKLMSTYLPNWEIKHLREEHLVIAPEMSSRNLDVDICYGKRWWHNNDGEFEFKINPSSIGSFEILGDSEEKEYFSGIGIILTNNEFATKLHQILVEYYPIINTLNKDIQIVSEEISARIKKLQNEAERIHMIKTFEDTKNQIIATQNLLKKANNVNADFYVIVDECYMHSHLNNATYRGKELYILPLGVMTGSVARMKINQNPGRFYKIQKVKGIKLTV